MFCTYCGRELKADEKFCPQCGGGIVNCASAAASTQKTQKIGGLLNQSRIARLGAIKWYFISGIMLMLVNAFLSGKEMVLFE